MSEQIASALGFDFGLRRIGLAYGQTITSTARPLDPISARDGIPDWALVDRVVAQWQPEVIVVGLPLNMDGSISDMARRARKFANRLHERTKIPCYLYDERLTSFEAKEMHIARGGGRNFGTESVDGLAAQLMLEAWFQQDRLIPSHTRLEELYD
ncbi:MAG TPA: Holliday junction resolvase RuvX [Marinobacterium sp.]|nr:Holliday junction resolvase RuvX [Marinobacterium sp.]